MWYLMKNMHLLNNGQYKAMYFVVRQDNTNRIHRTNIYNSIRKLYSAPREEYMTTITKISDFGGNYGIIYTSDEDIVSNLKDLYPEEFI